MAYSLSVQSGGHQTEIKNYIQMKHIWNKGKILLLAGTLAFAITSCVDGYEDEKAWAPSVQNAQLESPDASGIKVVFSPDGLTHEISWKVVLGAGGYEVTVYNVDDPNNPVLVGEENQVIDGLKVTRPAKDDTKYKVLIKALGQAKYNNKEALNPTEKLYTNLLSSSGTIPTGTDLAQYFKDNPIPAECDSTMCFDLEAGGTFTISDTINQKMSSLLIRGDKVQRATITINDKGSFVNGGAGFKLQYVDISYSEPSAKPLIALDPVFNKYGKPRSTANFLLIPATSPIAVQNCKITGMKNNLLSGGNQKYAVAALLIKECVIGYNSATFNNGVFHSGNGSDDGNDVMTIKDASITNCTFYNEQITTGSSNYFMRLQGSAINAVGTFPTGEVWAGGSLSITNCTFYQIGPNAQIANFRRNQWKTTSDKITVQKCVFVNSYNDQTGADANRAASSAIIRRIRGDSNNPLFTCGYNSYWYNGAFVTGELYTDCPSGCNGRGDNSTTYIITDPGLTYAGNGVFTMTGADQITNRTGDPRWLPAQ